MSKAKHIDGIVLAAGASTRMGSSKALLEVDGTTFLERAIHVLREAGCRYVVAVVGDDEWAQRLADVSGAAVVVNDQNGSEQIDSLRIGIANLPEDSQAAVVLPVDFPRVKSTTIATLLREFTGGRSSILNPSYNGQAGHPVIFASSVYPDLLVPDLPNGARTVIDDRAESARVIEVDDAGVLIDVDTRSDYQKHVQRGDANHTG